MKKTFSFIGCLWIGWAATLSAQEEPKTPPPPAEIPQSVLEERFIQTLTKATFNGRWCSVEGGKLGEAKDETYTIQGVKKVGGDLWLIQARIQYGQRDLTIPIPVRVKWAGDSPVISVTDFGIPGGGTYTARVLVYQDTYAGTWSGGKHGGLLSGVISRESKE